VVKWIYVKLLVQNNLLLYAQTQNALLEQINTTIKKISYTIGIAILGDINKW